MSTRANIIVTDESGAKLWFYRHSDGYPEGAMPLLQKFMGWVRCGAVRDNIQQASGWLIILGAIEYGMIPAYESEEPGPYRTYGKVETTEKPGDWKCGAIEPTDWGRHGDIEYLYVLNLTERTIACYGAAWSDDEQRPNDLWPEDELLFVDTADKAWAPTPTVTGRCRWFRVIGSAD